MKQNILLLIILLAAIGCKDSSTTVVNTGGSDVTGTMKGMVSLYDGSGALVADKSGVRVELIGTSFSAVTDTSGLWIIDNLPSRTYDLKFTKAGYGTIISQYQFLGGSTLWFATSDSPLPLRQPPPFTITLDAIIKPAAPFKDSLGLFHLQNGKVFYHYSKTTPTNIYFGNILITSRNPSLDLSDPSSYQQITFPSRQFKNTVDSVVSGDQALGYQEGLLAGFASGETVYFKAYPFVYQATYYYDVKTFTKVYTSYGTESNVLSITAP